MFAFIFLSGNAWAQTKESSFWQVEDSQLLLNTVLIAALVVVLLAFFVMLYLLRVFRLLLDLKKEAIGKSQGIAVEAVKEEKNLFDRWNAAVAIEDEHKILLDHDYDGIRELDNHLPPWWKYLFYATIVFAIVYVGVYHVWKIRPLQAEEYQQELALAKEDMEARMAAIGERIDESNVELTRDSNDIKNGQEVYMASCSPCHGKAGEGGVGPNLADEYWLHGGSIKDIFRTIKHGVPGKGMVAWEGKLSPVQMRDVSSFVISLEGTNPPNGKEPQGEKYVREEAEVFHASAGN
ncbi:c-type cytochrome [Cytophagales bacterium RKSG123]|nr:c-type cytochrome [Xanthovirga aplysinae]